MLNFKTGTSPLAEIRWSSYERRHGWFEIKLYEFADRTGANCFLSMDKEDAEMLLKELKLFLENTHGL